MKETEMLDRSTEPEDYSDRILPPEQKKIANFLKINIFPNLPEKHFFLVGGTAIALKYGHRQSIDFDFFSFPLQNVHDEEIDVVDKLFRKHDFYHRKDIAPVYGQLHYNINNVGLSFLGFQNLFAESEQELYKIPLLSTEKLFDFDVLNIRDLAGLKAFARCQRSKMKDLVDIAEILHHQVFLQDIISSAEEIFGYDFSVKEFLNACLNIDDILENEIDEPIIFLTEKDTDYYISYLKEQLKEFYGGITTQD